MKRKNRATETVPHERQKRKRPSIEIPSPELSDAEDNNDTSEQTSTKDVASPLTPASLPQTHKPPSEQKTHRCPYTSCPKSFNRPARLAEHIRSHTNERPFKCPEADCLKDFLRETHLKHHVKSAHSSVRDYACEFAGCDKKFLTGTRLKRHQAVHEGRNRYRCTEYAPCQEVFRKHATLQRHVLSVHLGRKPYICGETAEGNDGGEGCKEGFDTPAQLRRHRARLHEGLRYWCSECVVPADVTPSTAEEEEDEEQATTTKRFAFATYAELQSHLREIHPPTCIFCNQSCVSPRHLRQHIASHHPEVVTQSAEDDTIIPATSSRKLHRCPKQNCLKLFTRRHNLKIHLRTVHEGEKQFVCSPDTELKLSRDIPEKWWEFIPLNVSSGVGVGDVGERRKSAKNGPCNKAFQTKGNLEEHVRTQHLGFPSSERPSKKRPREGQAGSVLDGRSIIQHDDWQGAIEGTMNDIGTVKMGTKTKTGTRSRQNTKEENTPSVIAQLTGTGSYGYTTPSLSGRHIECLLAPGCPLRFKRQWDLITHLRVGHGVFVSSGDDSSVDFSLEEEAEEEEDNGDGDGDGDGNDEGRDWFENGDGNWEAEMSGYQSMEGWS